MSSDYEARLRSLLMADGHRCRILAWVRDLALPDCWVGAGFVREMVWNALAGRAVGQRTGDIDVIWFDSDNMTIDADKKIESRLRRVSPGLPWSVKNQSRMHARNNDEPYTSCGHAISFWPETATAVALRLTVSGEIDILAPYGLADLFQGVLRPTPAFSREKHAIFEARLRDKAWLRQWPFLSVSAT